MEKNYLVGIFGEHLEDRSLVGQAIGSPGTSSDLYFYNRLDPELGVFCAITPVDYPEKIKAFAQTLYMTNIHILVLNLRDDLNAVIGEILVGMDISRRIFNSKCLIALKGIDSKTEWKLEAYRYKLKAIINTTSLNQTEIIEIRNKSDYETLRQKIVKLGDDDYNKQSIESNITKVIIDHAFPIKGIGTVILGIIKEGHLSASQMVELTGSSGAGKNVIIRSIQKHDRDFKEAFPGERVGLALKGNISSSDITRDNLLVNKGTFIGEKNFKCRLHINKFFKPKSGKIDSREGIQYYAMVETKVSPIKIEDGEEITPGSSGVVKLRADKPLYHNGNGLKGLLLDLNKFNGKLRVIGHFHQLKRI